MNKSITVSRNCARRLNSGHPWGFRGEIRKRKGHPKAGDMVLVQDEQKIPICWAFYSPKPHIALRRISHSETPPPHDIWAKRIQLAAELRQKIIRPDTNAFRAVYSEADGLPGLIVDKYADYLVVQQLTAGIEQVWPQIQEALVDIYQPKGILARNDLRTREIEGLEPGKTLLFGEMPQEIEVQENGMRFIVQPWDGHKTGAFLDQRETRVAIRPYIRGRVLDTFSYQGWFALQCADQAEEVIAVDASAPALEMVARNCALNNITNVTAHKANVFKFLYNSDANERYDAILLDPPAFCKTEKAIEAGIRAYREINTQALALLEPGGILITSSCSYHLTESRFMDVLEYAAAKSGRTLQLLERLGQGPDHPRLLGHGESLYLKSYVLRAL